MYIKQDKGKGKAMKRRIEVRGNGNQVPYGIGEIIADYPDTSAGRKKAIRKAVYWYNPASVVGPDGKIDIDWNVVRKQDRGYVDER